MTTTSIDSAGSDLGQVHDAFFIGIEDEAKERLERLAASKRITPVDITKLAHQVRFRRKRARHEFCVIYLKTDRIRLSHD